MTRDEFLIQATLAALRSGCGGVESTDRARIADRELRNNLKVRFTPPAATDMPLERPSGGA